MMKTRLFSITLACALMACNGQLVTPNQNPDAGFVAWEHPDPVGQQKQALNCNTTFTCVTADNTACTGALTKTVNLPGTGTDTLAFISHMEGNVSYNGNPVPDNISITDGPGTRTISATATRCEDHVKACYGTVPWACFNFGAPKQSTGQQIGASSGTTQATASQGEYSTLVAIDRLTGSFGSANDVAQDYTPGAPLVGVEGFEITANTSGVSPWAGNAARMTFYSWANPGSGAEPCQLPIGGAAWNSESCKRVHTGADDACIKLFPVSSSSTASYLATSGSCARPPQNEVCTFDRVGGPFASSGSYVDVSLQPSPFDGSTTWMVSVGDTNGSAIPQAHATCYSFTLTSN